MSTPRVTTWLLSRMPTGKPGRDSTEAMTNITFNAEAGTKALDILKNISHDRGPQGRLIL